MGVADDLPKNWLSYIRLRSGRGNSLIFGVLPNGQSVEFGAGLMTEARRHLGRAKQGFKEFFEPDPETGGE